MQLNEAAAAERYPVPPEDLRWRAIGAREPEAFLQSGSAAVDFLDQEALGKERKSLRDFSSILDFGCGCGRLVRSLKPLSDQWASIHGADIDRAAVAWCRDNLADADFVLNDEYPPLPYLDSSIELAVACSVFSHLDAEHQNRWLAELQRIMKPGGYLLLTFRYRDSIDQIADQTIRDRIWTDLNRDGIAYMPTDTWKGAFPAWYGEAYHTPEYIHKNWGSYFEVCHIHPVGAIPEETVVLRARESTFLQRLFQRP
jgi:SAM-dependent methyltransferase